MMGKAGDGLSMLSVPGRESTLSQSQVVPNSKGGKWEGKGAEAAEGQAAAVELTVALTQAQD